MKKVTPEVLKTKHHFEILNGLRGVAALSVVTFHFMEIAYSDYSQNFIGHGFLAVDFFFCLSGFVIGYAYDDRLGKMGIWEFFKSRIIRLHPLVVFGSVLGLLAFIFDPFGTQAALYSFGRTFLIFIASAFLIPFPTMAERYYNLFNLNAPSWSLFWEYIANIFYALVFFRLARKYLLLLMIAGAAILCFVAYKSTNLMGGWSGGTFWDGGARIFYSFLAGLLVFRYKLVIKNKLGFLGVAILLFAAFVSPFSNKWNFITEPLLVIVYFPFIIALGTGATLAPWLKKICVFAGNISYPLYMTHYAVMFMFANYWANHKMAPGHLAIFIIISLVLLVSIAYLVMTLYDIPVRKYLTNKRKQALKA